MLYSLPNGKVIELSIDQYLDMTDEELEYIIALNCGENIENPFFGSVISSTSPGFILDTFFDDPEDEESQEENDEDVQ